MLKSPELRAVKGFVDAVTITRFVFFKQKLNKDNNLNVSKISCQISAVICHALLLKTSRMIKRELQVDGRFRRTRGMHQYLRHRRRLHHKEIGA